MPSTLETRMVCRGAAGEEQRGLSPDQKWVSRRLQFPDQSDCCLPKRGSRPLRVIPSTTTAPLVADGRKLCSQNEPGRAVGCMCRMSPEVCRCDAARGSTEPRCSFADADGGSLRVRSERYSTHFGRGPRLIPGLGRRSADQLESDGHALLFTRRESSAKVYRVIWRREKNSLKQRCREIRRRCNIGPILVTPMERRCVRLPPNSRRPVPVEGSLRASSPPELPPHNAVEESRRTGYLATTRALDP